MNLALAIIAKDEKQELDRIISDYGKYFDEIVIAWDTEPLYVSDNPKVKVFKYEWIDDFAHKRNWLAEKVNSPYYLRIDCDDIIENPENIGEVFALTTSGNFDLCYVPYIYSMDEDGNCNAKHSRETIIRKRPDVYWNKKIHENVFIVNPKLAKICHTDKIKIIHKLTQEHALASQQRNFKLLMQEFQQDGEKTDPRTIGYIGRVLMGSGEYKKAIPFLELLIKKSGWDDDKYFAWIHLSECFHSLGDLKTAIAACNEALAINTKFPDAYLKLGNIYLYKKEYDKALDWLMSGFVRPEPNTVFVIDPSVYGYRARMFIALAYLGKGDFENALKYFEAAKKLAPNADFVLKQEKTFNEAYYNDQYIRHLVWLVQYHAQHDKDKIPALIDSIDSSILKDERVWSLRNKYIPAKTWDNKSVVIYCGIAWEEWADPSVVKGIGGSEEAVIYLSRELVKLGWKVTVYNFCGDLAGEYNGVTYRNYYEFNPSDTFNIIVSWRNNIFVEDIRARKKIIWMHDVPYREQFQDDYANTFHHAVVLSQYHKSLLPEHIPEVLKYVSSNGINLEDYQLEGITRNPHRIIYTSSYDRGLINLLNIWDEVLEEVPDAELHVFYGWETWMSMEEKGYRPREARILMQRIMKKKGVFDHGRVGHKELIKEFYKSGIYAYPCHFEEISCISAMKAQACGCVALTTDYAALAETNKYGLKVEGKAEIGDTNERFKKALILLLKHPELQEEYRKKGIENKAEWGWDKVAKDWNDNLFAFRKLQFKDLEDFKKVYRMSSIHSLIPLEYNAIYPRTVRAVKFLRGHPELKTGIDLGSFDGSLAVHLCREVKGFKCDAMDIRDKEFNYARSVIQMENLPMEIFTGKAIEEFNPPNKYDSAFLMEALEHTIDPKVVLKQISTFLNSGGYLMITVPDKDGKFGEAQDPLFNSSHLRDYTMDTLKADIPDCFELKDMFIEEGLITAILKNK